tara:strand:- start:2349 stop:2570 length:222 start_codon:yes stop_codon:yes gene_type:complete
MESNMDLLINIGKIGLKLNDYQNNSYKINKILKMENFNENKNKFNNEKITFIVSTSLILVILIVITYLVLKKK